MARSTGHRPAQDGAVPDAETSVLATVDPEERAKLLMRDLRASASGLSSNEAHRRLEQYGPNALRRRGGWSWPAELAHQLTHPLALLLWLASSLSFAVGNEAVAIAVLLVILLNAVFAFVQELQAERAVEALAAYMPPRVRVRRDGETVSIDAVEIVPGDIALIEEGDRIAADVRLLSGAIEVDISTLTGESAPVLRSAEFLDHDMPRLAARELVFSGTSCIAGEALGIVFATGMHTELGRIAALSERVKPQPSPLEQQVRRVAWLIAAVAVTMSIAFVPLAVLGAGLSIRNSVVFAVGLLAGNVPEGLLPVITLALAVAVSALARRGALVKRLSSVETLGSTDVICTDKTGTLTRNQMSPVMAWTPAGEIDLGERAPRVETDRSKLALARAAAAANNATIGPNGATAGDPTEIAVLRAATRLAPELEPSTVRANRKTEYRFDSEHKLMSTLDSLEGKQVLHTKGAPEAVLARCTTMLASNGERTALEPEQRTLILRQVESLAKRGLRVLGFAERPMPSQASTPTRVQAERELCFLGLIAMLDPPRPETVDAVSACHEAGIRVIVITGDHPLTAGAIAARVGIGGDAPAVLDASKIDYTHQQWLRERLATHEELVFARASPEAKLQIADALRHAGHVVAMTGDGVNDAPALRRADIGIAMGRSGTEVAREASTMVLTDDNFATIVTAVRAGRRVYENVRKFIVYIFAHATPEVCAFLVFAFSGGAVPLPLNVLQLLAFDVGTETLPSLALGHDPAEPGIMHRRPRPRSESVIRRTMLLRAWLFLGAIVAVLALGGFFYVLLEAGWQPGDPVGRGHALHQAYLQAATMTFVGMVAGQIGTAFAVRAGRQPLRSVGAFSNRYLLFAIFAEVGLAALFVYAPPMHSLLGTASLPARYVALLIPYPFIVWGADEVRRSLAAGTRSMDGAVSRSPA